MKISLKQKDIAFAMSPLREDRSFNDLLLLKQIKEKLTPYEPETVVEIEIEKERLFAIYQRISSEREGLSAAIAESIMESDEDYVGLADQIGAKAQTGDEDFIWLYQQVTAWRTNFQALVTETIQQNLNFLESLPL
jgi:hypothetical protein